MFKWLDCIQRAPPSNVFLKKELGKIKVWILVFIFEVITSFSHFYLAKYDELYHLDLQNQINPARWREYTITNTLMIIAILSLSNVSDIYLLLSIGLAAATMNYVGGFVYELLGSFEKMINIDPRRKQLIREAKIMILVLTWTTFVISLVYIFDMFFLGVDPLYDLDSGPLWRQFFLIILVLNVGIVFCYSIFPILHALQHGYLAPGVKLDYITIEKGYIIASLLAKSFLSLVVFAATIQRS